MCVLNVNLMFHNILNNNLNIKHFISFIYTYIKILISYHQIRYDGRLLSYVSGKCKKWMWFFLMLCRLYIDLQQFIITWILLSGWFKNHPRHVINVFFLPYHPSHWKLSLFFMYVCWVFINILSRCTTKYSRE